jgi:hypothetical protein
LLGSFIAMISKSLLANRPLDPQSSIVDLLPPL